MATTVWQVQDIQKEVSAMEALPFFALIEGQDHQPAEVGS